MSLREKYKGSGDLRRDVVKGVPEWGDVLIRELSAPELEEYQMAQLNFAKLDDKGMPTRSAKIDFARLACWGVVDEAGVRVFTDEDLAWLRTKPNRVLEPIGTAVLRLTGIGGEEKNSSTTPASSESTCSPGNSDTPTPSA